ncbi:MAG: NAD-dependent epimerase/dehydratase family protein, partial [Lysinibacillus sp.]
MIAVIGGAGYIGSHTVKYLMQQGKDVVVFDNLSSGHKEFIPSNVPFFEGDLACKEDLQSLFTK